MEELDAQILAALALAGVQASADDLPLLRLVHGAYAPGLAALRSPEIAKLPAEPGLDPSRAPLA